MYLPVPLNAFDEQIRTLTLRFKMCKTRTQCNQQEKWTRYQHGVKHRHRHDGRRDKCEDFRDAVVRNQLLTKTTPYPEERERERELTFSKNV
jgi:hypothetical protein